MFLEFLANYFFIFIFFFFLLFILSLNWNDRAGKASFPVKLVRGQEGFIYSALSVLLDLFFFELLGQKLEAFVLANLLDDWHF